MRKFFSYLIKSSPCLRTFSGATVSHFKQHVVPILNEETTNKLIFHGGYNDLPNKSRTPKNSGKDRQIR